MMINLDIMRKGFSMNYSFFHKNEFFSMKTKTRKKKLRRTLLSKIMDDMSILIFQKFLIIVYVYKYRHILVKKMRIVDIKYCAKWD